MRRGFTLIELLVVIAIIAILAAILFPVFSRVKARAESASCLSNMKQLATALLMYAHDWDQCTEPDFYGANSHWRPMFDPYLQNTQVYFCPSETITIDPWNDYNLGYGCTNWRGNYRGKSIDSFPYPTHFITFLEQKQGNNRGWWKYTVNGVDFWWNEGDCTQLDNFDSTAEPPISGTAGGRHFGNTNCMFMDGHVQSMPLQYLAQGTMPKLTPAIKVVDYYCSALANNDQWSGQSYP